MVARASPAMVHPVIDAIGARRWIPGIAPPTRFVCEPTEVSSMGERVGLVAADRGHDLQWLIDAG